VLLKDRLIEEDEGRNTVFRLLVEKDFIQTAKYLAELAHEDGCLLDALSIKDGNDFTPINAAVEFSKDDMVRVLLENILDNEDALKSILSMPDIFGNTPLSKIAMSDNSELLEYIASKSSNVILMTIKDEIVVPDLKIIENESKESITIKDEIVVQEDLKIIENESKESITIKDKHAALNVQKLNAILFENALSGPFDNKIGSALREKNSLNTQLNALNKNIEVDKVRIQQIDKDIQELERSNLPADLNTSSKKTRNAIEKQRRATEKEQQKIGELKKEKNEISSSLGEKQNGCSKADSNLSTAKEKLKSLESKKTIFKAAQIVNKLPQLVDDSVYFAKEFAGFDIDQYLAYLINKTPPLNQESGCDLPGINVGDFFSYISDTVKLGSTAVMAYLSEGADKPFAIANMALNTETAQYYLPYNIHLINAVGATAVGFIAGGWPVACVQGMNFGLEYGIKNDYIAKNNPVVEYFAKPLLTVINQGTSILYSSGNVLKAFEVLHFGRQLYDYYKLYADSFAIDDEQFPVLKKLGYSASELFAEISEKAGDNEPNITVYPEDIEKEEVWCMNENTNGTLYTRFEQCFGDFDHCPA